jgi:hypothetical protein
LNYPRKGDGWAKWWWSSEYAEKALQLQSHGRQAGSGTETESVHDRPGYLGRGPGLDRVDRHLGEERE